MMKFISNADQSKDPYVAAGKEKKPLFALLAQFIRKGWRFG